MSVYENLGPGDRAEIDAAVRAAYDDGDGGVRPRADAAEDFLSWMASATQAHREYTDELRAEWERNGSSAFVQDRWKALGGTLRLTRQDGTVHVRPRTRGARLYDPMGRPDYRQQDLVLWDADELRAGIAEAVKRMEAERDTIRLYSALLDLLERTGCQLVQEALDAEGVTLDQFTTAAAS